MKDFFKKHPELLILIVIVIIIDCAIMWMWLDDTSATEQSFKEIESLRGQAKQINESSYSITNENAQKAQVESKKWEDAFNKEYAQKSSKYVLETEYQTGMSPAKAKKIIKDRVNYLIDEILLDKNATGDRLSFGRYDNNELFSMSAAERKIVFEVLAATEQLINICVDTDVMTINSIGRPNNLTYALDKNLNLKNYRFLLKTTCSAEGVKRLMNRIVSDEKFYFEINSFVLNADQQVVSGPDDIRPKIERAGQGSKVIKTPNELDEIEIEIDDPDSGSQNTSSTKLQEESVAPFVDAKVNLELTIDWVQFNKVTK